MKSLKKLIQNWEYYSTEEKIFWVSAIVVIAIGTIVVYCIQNSRKYKNKRLSTLMKNVAKTEYSEYGNVVVAAARRRTLFWYGLAGIFVYSLFIGGGLVFYQEEGDPIILVGMAVLVLLVFLFQLILVIKNFSRVILVQDKLILKKLFRSGEVRYRFSEISNVQLRHFKKRYSLRVWLHGQGDSDYQKHWLDFVDFQDLTVLTEVLGTIIDEEIPKMNDLDMEALYATPEVAI